MYASEKQLNFIKSLWEKISEYAPKLTDDVAEEVAAKITPFKPVLVKVMSDDDITKKEASDIIPILMELKDKVEPKERAIKWRKLGENWFIHGSEDVLIPGEEVEVTSKKGKQKVIVGETIVDSNDSSKVFAKVVKPEVEGNATDKPGFYKHEGKIIEAYFTRKGILVAREVLDDGSKEYLGKAGLVGLTEENKLTLEDAKQFGKETGICMNCGAKLTNPQSIEDGIGPICAAKWC